MALIGSQLIDEVRAIVGREGSTDSGVITDTRITRYLNEAQEAIVEECVGLHSMSFVNTTSLDTTAQLKYAISDITVGDLSTGGERIARIWDVYYLDGEDSRHLTWMSTDEFDEKYPDATHSDIATGKPSHWTRRGQYIEIFPLPSSGYYDKDLRFDGDYYAADFTTNDATASDISLADEGLIAYAAWKAWGSISGKEATLEEVKWKMTYQEWLEGFKAKNDNLHEWDGNLYGNELI